MSEKLVLFRDEHDRLGLIQRHCPHRGTDLSYGRIEDGGLRSAIERVVGRSKTSPKSRLEARRRAQSAAEDAVVVLRSEGYYDYEVVPDVAGDPPKPVVKITPGPRYLLADPKIDWVGEAPDREVAAAARTAMNLEPGKPGRAADV